MAFRIDQWNVEPRPWGWFRLRETSGEGPTIYLQYQLEGEEGKERVGLQSVVMRASTSETLSGRVWRRVPMSRIEQAISALLSLTKPGLPEHLADAGLTTRKMFHARDVTPPSLDTLDEYFEATKDITPVTWGLMPSDMLVSESGGRIPRIKPPEGRLTDEFLEDVADAYRWFTDAGQAPAPAISESSGVPVRTVQRWIYEARKRGILPPARSGRAG